MLLSDDLFLGVFLRILTIALIYWNQKFIVATKVNVWHKGTVVFMLDGTPILSHNGYICLRWCHSDKVLVPYIKIYGACTHSQWARPVTFYDYLISNFAYIIRLWCIVNMDLNVLHRLHKVCPLYRSGQWQRFYVCLSGSPFQFNVLNPEKVIVRGSGLELVPVNECATFTIVAPCAQIQDIDVVIKGCYGVLL